MISAIISSIWNVFIKFHWHDEKLTQAETKALAEAEEKAKLEQASEIEIEAEESDEEQRWQVFQIFSCPLCRFSSPNPQITAEHMFTHIQVHNLRAPKGTLGSAFD